MLSDHTRSSEPDLFGFDMGNHGMKSGVSQMIWNQNEINDIIFLNSTLL